MVVVFLVIVFLLVNVFFLGFSEACVLVANCNSALSHTRGGEGRTEGERDRQRERETDRGRERDRRSLLLFSARAGAVASLARSKLEQSVQYIWPSAWPRQSVTE